MKKLELILAENMRRFNTKNLTENIRNNKDFKDDVLFIFTYASQGSDMTDNIIDEMGDYFKKVYASNDQQIKDAYNKLRMCADDTPASQAEAAQSLLSLL